MDTTTSYTWKELWHGAGPAASPTGSPPGLVIVHAPEAWTRVMASYGPPPDDAIAGLPVDWSHDLILFIDGPDSTPDASVQLTSLARANGDVTVVAVGHAGPPDEPKLAVVVRPWLVASAPAAALAGATTVHFTLDGRELPVRHER